MPRPDVRRNSSGCCGACQLITSSACGARLRFLRRTKGGGRGRPPHTNAASGFDSQAASRAPTPKCMRASAAIACRTIPNTKLSSASAIRRSCGCELVERLSGVSSAGDSPGGLSEESGCNTKVSNLAQMLPQAKYEYHSRQRQRHPGPVRLLAAGRGSAERSPGRAGDLPLSRDRRSDSGFAAGSNRHQHGFFRRSAGGAAT